MGQCARRGWKADLAVRRLLHQAQAGQHLLRQQPLHRLEEVDALLGLLAPQLAHALGHLRGLACIDLCKGFPAWQASVIAGTQSLHKYYQINKN